MAVTRRTLLSLMAASGLAPLAARLQAQEAWRHGLSLFGNLKYGADFTRFDYVNPHAPKGGRVRLHALGSFDSLNPFTFKGSSATLIGAITDTLLTSALDEPSSEYGLVAEAVRHPDDFSWVEYRLRPEARFHDGRQMSVEDVIWTMQALKGAHPFYAFYYKNIVKAEQTGERAVRFTFSGGGNRELPQITGQMPVLPKHWWTGVDAKGRKRDIKATTLEPLLGSGPYRIGEVKPGRSISVRRVDDYWGKDLPVNRGHYNFDEIIAYYFRDSTIALEAFKGDQYDWRDESSSKAWATGYDFPAVKSGAVIKEEITLKNGRGMQAFAFNLRRAKFADARVRRAFNFAFDFEWSNRNLFYGQYKRTDSYFENSELAWNGGPQGADLPSPAELKLLEPLRDKVPAEVFTETFTNPVNNSPRDVRANLRRAARLFAAAGLKPGDGGTLTGADGKPFTVEFLLVSPLFERIVLPYARQLERLGVKSVVRTVDSAQYRRRVQNFDYDIIVANWGQSLSPGNEQRDFWGSQAADRPGSRNYVGIKDAAVDALIDAIIFATSREALIAACRALDRVLLWHHYIVPMWHIPYERTARWDRFGRPEKLPDYSLGFPSIWWWDEERAKATDARK